MPPANYKSLSICRRLLLQARPYRLHLIAIFVLSLLAMPLALVTPLPLKIAVDSVIDSRPLPHLLTALLPAAAMSSKTAVLLVAIGLLIGITLLSHLQALAGWLLPTYVGEKLTLNFRALLLRHVQRLSISYHDTQGTTESTYRIQYDAASIQYILINGAIPLISSVCTLIGMIIVTSMIDWQLAVISLLVCPVLFLITGAFGSRIRTRWREVKSLDSSAMSIVQEVLSAVRVVKAFGREEYEQQRFLRRSDERLKGELDVAWLQGTFDLFIGLTLGIGTAAVIFIGVTHVRSGILTLGELLIVMAYLAQIYDPLKTIAKKLGDLQASIVGAERAFAILDEVPEVIERPHARSLMRAKGAVSFRNVCFSYDKEREVLRNIVLDVPPGARVGIQGRTGAGKSTLVSLLMRFYDPDTGEILLDGIDLRQYKLADLRNQFSMVLQDPMLFSTSIAENIAYANPKATEEQIVKAAQLANAHDFVTRLPEGYHTEVGERGMKLSGGERQRISLARAFLKNAPILILDEPTSSVDMATEATIMEAMERLMHGRTTFMIAHRLSTLESCDIRLELEGGRLVTAASSGCVER